MATEIVRKCETHLIETSFAKFRVRIVRMYVERQGRSQYEVNRGTCLNNLFPFCCFLFSVSVVVVVVVFFKNADPVVRLHS